MRVNHNAESAASSGDNHLMDVRSLDLRDDGLAETVLDLQRAAYRIEADLIGSDAIPPLHETLAELTEAPLQWLGISDRGASIRIPVGTVQNGWKGYLEDRRPASNADPYKVVGEILATLRS